MTDRMFAYNYRIYDRYAKTVVSLAVLGEPSRSKHGDILELFRFIDWVLTLPEGLEQQLWSEVQQFDEEKHMHYLSSIERMAQQKGIEQRIEQGTEQGIGEGQAKLLHVLVQQRFGQVAPEIEARIRSARSDQLEQWALRVLDAQCLEDVFGATVEH